MSISRSIPFFVFILHRHNYDQIKPFRASGDGRLANSSGENSSKYFVNNLFPKTSYNYDVIISAIDFYINLYI